MSKVDSRFGVAVILVVSLVSSFLTYYAVIYDLTLGMPRNSVSRLLILANVLAALGLSFVMLEYFLECRRVEKIDKGCKIAGFRSESKISNIPTVAGVWIMLVIILIVLSLTTDSILNTCLISATFLILFVTVSSGKRRVEIYEGGIIHGCEFIVWDEIEDYDWKDKRLTLKLKNGKSINVDKSVGSVIITYMKYLKK
ncbi:hypothetical protein [Archaeoglobus sp.]